MLEFSASPTLGYDNDAFHLSMHTFEASVALCRWGLSGAAPGCICNMLTGFPDASFCRPLASVYYEGEICEHGLGYMRSSMRPLL